MCRSQPYKLREHRRRWLEPPARYDALVGATAKHHGILLATRDRRAADTYRSLDVDCEILG
jgi:predicted nucleic acid-binding protein